MEEKDYALWLSTIDELELNCKHKLIKEYDNPYGVWYNVANPQTESLLTKRQYYYLQNSKNLFNIEKTREKLYELNARYIYHKDEDFPRKLLEIPDPPIGIFVIGNVPKDDTPSVAVVGSRGCSEYGRTVTESLVGELSSYNFQIISGLAMGIDGIAHKSCLDAGGFTAGVLGCGIGKVYPRENSGLFEEMYKKGGVISEYYIGSYSLKQHFPERNRLISGLSDVVIVIEARKKSGTLITVDRALNQGKEVFVVPGRIGDSLSEGCLELIKQGANIITESNDIALAIKDLYPEFTAYEKENDYKYRIKNPEKDMKFTLEKDEIIVYSLLRLDPKHLDELVIESELNYFQVFSILQSLIEKGAVIESSPEYFIKNNR